MIHGSELVSDCIENHDQEVASVVLVLKFGNALCHIEEQLGAHGLEARARKIVMQISCVDFNCSTDLIAVERFPDVVNQICQHAVRERPHGFIDCQAVSDECPFIEQLIDLLEEDLAVVEIDNMSDRNK